MKAVVVHGDGLGGGLLKPATVSLGQAMQLDVRRGPRRPPRPAPGLLAVGSSLVEVPAAFDPPSGEGGGTGLVIVNGSRARSTVYPIP